MQFRNLGAAEADTLEIELVDDPARVLTRLAGFVAHVLERAAGIGKVERLRLFSGSFGGLDLFRDLLRVAGLELEDRLDRDRAAVHSPGAVLDGDLVLREVLDAAVLVDDRDLLDDV